MHRPQVFVLALLVSAIVVGCRINPADPITRAGVGDACGPPPCAVGLICVEGACEVDPNAPVDASGDAAEDAAGDVPSDGSGEDAAVDVVADGADDTVEDATVDTGPRTCLEADCDLAGICIESDAGDICQCADGFVRVGRFRCLTEAEAGVCGTLPCTRANQTVCSNVAEAEGGFECACDPGFVRSDGLCRPEECADLRVRTEATVFDLSPLSGVSDPVTTGYDPLMPADLVRVTIDVEATSAGVGSVVRVEFDNLELFDSTVLLDGNGVTLSGFIPGSSFFRVTLPDNGSHELRFDAQVSGADGPISIEAHVETAEGCFIAESGTAVRAFVGSATSRSASGCIDMSDFTNVMTMLDVPDRDTTPYDAITETSLTYGTGRVLQEIALCVVRNDGQTVFLSGSADGTRPWMVDNFLLIETFDRNPDSGGERQAAYITNTQNGVTAPTLADLTPLPVLHLASLPGDYLGSMTTARFGFPAGVVQLDELLPAGEAVWVRLTAIDGDSVGRVSRLYLQSSPVDAPPAECITHFDCATEESRDGTAYTLAAGCVEGACSGVACAAEGECAAGQRCLNGFCTAGCSVTEPCPEGEECSAEGWCVTPETPTECRVYSDCAAGEVCFFGRCEAGCYHPVHQRADYSDNDGTLSLCRLNVDACPRCLVDTDRCWNNFCQQCEIEAHCNPGELCLDGVCRAPM